MLSSLISARADWVSFPPGVELRGRADSLPPPTLFPANWTCLTARSAWSSTLQLIAWRILFTAFLRGVNFRCPTSLWYALGLYSQDSHLFYLRGAELQNFLPVACFVHTIQDFYPWAPRFQLPAPSAIKFLSSVHSLDLGGSLFLLWMPSWVACSYVSYRRKPLLFAITRSPCSNLQHFTLLGQLELTVRYCSQP